jgi:hypothetical protein
MGWRGRVFVIKVLPAVFVINMLLYQPQAHLIATNTISNLTGLMIRRESSSDQTQAELFLPPPTNYHGGGLL